MTSSDKKDEKKNTKDGTRVFKKMCLDGKISTYIGTREFVDHVGHIDPIAAVLLIHEMDWFTENKEYKVYAEITATFRYGRDDLDVLGINFKKDLYTDAMQVYPVKGVASCTTKIQGKLLKKLGSERAFPFTFDLPAGIPSSVTLQPVKNDTSSKPCGVEYCLKTYVAKDMHEPPDRKQVVDLLIKKITHAPDTQAPQPYIESAKNFMMSPNPLHVEARLDKERYIHGEPIYVHITMGNQSTRAVKKLRLSVKQVANICLFSNAIYKCTVASVEHDLNVQPSQTIAQTFSIRPLLEDNRDKRGLALDGQIKSEDTNLASSTMHLGGGGQASTQNSIARGGLEAMVTLTKALPIANREALGIVVKYIVKIELFVSMGGELKLELPFTLSHPIPEHYEEDMEPPPQPTDANADNINLELDETGAYNNTLLSAQADHDDPLIDLEAAPLHDGGANSSTATNY
ncbi:beta-arrestin-1-like isoform X2 [Bolinopsis microptera]|uniref:beta-arrestin-1-like isoform X2 n=1 Tax=Bolinopsis microptera TaxID=2820187 RepID=UPI00307ADBA2